MLKKKHLNPALKAYTWRRVCFSNLYKHTCNSQFKTCPKAEMALSKLSSVKGITKYITQILFSLCVCLHVRV